MSTKILLLEDDINLGEIVSEFLEEEGFDVTLVENAQEAQDKAYEKNFDLWILDVKVPQGDGFSVLKNLRESGKYTPAIFMTSLNTTMDLQKGFESGCDDYIKKPFELEELKIRINAILKRSFAHKNEDYEDLGNGFKFALISQTLYHNDKALSLPLKELKLLALLLKNKGKFIDTAYIFEEIWEYDQEPSELSLRAYIKNLRKILGKDSIVNQRGRGYCYV
ncbi:two-component system response regulator DccR [Campylobacter peloridis]|uniref:Response regulator transcription factor n=1 Tax=Campylobacter peloridis TaxID=488546 RepID=A0A5C7DYL0_9BACT|nr:response regulator transcription factor [Campylobacter peloridis]AJC85021.1 two-component system response regulator [Campylobacter peloridis LMG 23910]MBX1885874.1 response regulator transcription factor [Campylobacter peloridis]MBX2078242.1 response regulator transcription factor [Campylobacter peloridis]QOQ89056.1 response regulator transcription factor [Campylobacter peloridis]TXE84863.1 response regulator transcription factor [Campylobacter peloridis]